MSNFINFLLIIFIGNNFIHKINGGSGRHPHPAKSRWVPKFGQQCEHQVILDIPTLDITTITNHQAFCLQRGLRMCSPS